jgi:hypothetical protein
VKTRGWIEAVLLAAVVAAVLIGGMNHSQAQYANLLAHLSHQQDVTVCLLKIPPQHRSDPVVQLCLEHPNP